MVTKPRLAPDVPLPAYGYIPGHGAHPERDPDGHRHHEVTAKLGPAPTDDDHRSHDGYLHLLDLFNLGYYWEAHEVLEAWWREATAAPENSTRRSLFQGLLRLAAAGVKARDGRPNGVSKHCLRGAELLRKAIGDAEKTTLLGLEVVQLVAQATDLAASPIAVSPESASSRAEAVLPLRLELV